VKTIRLILGLPDHVRPYTENWRSGYAVVTIFNFFEGVTSTALEQQKIVLIASLFRGWRVELPVGQYAAEAVMPDGLRVDLNVSEESAVIGARPTAPVRTNLGLIARLPLQLSPMEDVPFRPANSRDVWLTSGAPLASVSHKPLAAQSALASFQTERGKQTQNVHADAAFTVSECVISATVNRRLFKGKSLSSEQLLNSLVGVGTVQFDEFASNEVDDLRIQAPKPLTDSLSGDLTEGLDGGQRRYYAGVQSGSRSYVVALPGIGEGLEVDLRFNNAETPIVAPSGSTGSGIKMVFTEAYPASLIGLLLAGRVSSALTLLDEGWERALGTYSSPLLSVVAAYVRLRGYERDAPVSWHSRVERLAIKYPKIPDTNIIHSALVLRQAPGLSTRFDDASRAVAFAKNLCIEALLAGIPFFSFGVKVLLENARLISALEGKNVSYREKNATKSLLEIALWLASHTETEQPLTVLFAAKRQSLKDKSDAISR